MIAASIGVDVTLFLERVHGRTHRFKEIVICSPFIDAVMVARLVAILVESRHTHCAVRVITTPRSARLLSIALPGYRTCWRSSVVTRRLLHAKVYLAVARRASESEAIVTSANLTIDGTSRNIELGVRVLATTELGRRVLDQVHHFVRRIAA